MNRPPLLAVTLHQPWASAIMAGVKPVENRTWIPRQLRGSSPRPLWLALHAGKATDRTLQEPVGPEPVTDDRPNGPGDIGGSGWRRPMTGWDYLATLWPGFPGKGHRWPRGFLGLVRFDAAGALEAFPEFGNNPWASGPKVWKVGAVLPLPEPIPAKGAQGLWPVPEVHVATFRKLYQAAKAEGRI